MGQLEEKIVRIIENNSPELAAEEILHLFNVSSSLKLTKCKCGQNSLPYKTQIELDKCSRCGNYR